MACVGQLQTFGLTVLGMPSLKAVGERAAMSASKLHGNLEAVWSIVNPLTMAHDGRGHYSYTGDSENIGMIKTIRPLDPQHKNGMSTFEVTIINSGNYVPCTVCPGPSYRDEMHCVVYIYMYIL